MSVQITQPPTPTSRIRAANREGRADEARALCLALLQKVIGKPVAKLEINADQYSLNSVNGIAETEGGEALFFKFHQEEGEEAGVGEYYNAQVLADAGYPVELPLFEETAPGRQMLVYRRVDDPRLSDVCASIEKGEGPFDADRVIAAQRTTDQTFASNALTSLGWSDDPAARSQPLFQLFYNRLADDPSDLEATALGGRVRNFYLGRNVDWPGLTARFEDIWELPWEINGLRYPASLKAGFEQGLRRLSALNLLPGPVVTAHGDAHNANVWFHPDRRDAPLSLFDPAFAGRAVPALLAEVKATFHNIFAHPFWLYEPDIAARRFTATARIEKAHVRVETDYRLTPLREAFLASKARHFWAPLLAELARRGWLAEDWEETVRTGLFACPTLVMNLLPSADSTHNPTSSLIGLAQAMRVLSAPEGGEGDPVTAFFNQIRSANGW